MKFRLWLESEEIAIPPNKSSTDYRQRWYHGTSGNDRIRGIRSKGRLITRSEGARPTNAAALGEGVYLTNNIDEAKAYCPAGIPSVIFAVQVEGHPKLLRIRNSPNDNALFYQIQNLGFGRDRPQKVNEVLRQHGYQGVHWDLQDGTQKIVVYDSALLSPVTTAAEYVPHGDALDGNWST